MTGTDPAANDRQWPRPAAPWVMRQTWNELLFAHWPLPVDALRAVVPPVLPIDTYDGQAWIGIVPFWMSGVRPRAMPSVPRLSTFPELNVRTYVTLDGKPGVYFFSLDAANPLAVLGARVGFHLPYFQAHMNVNRVDGWIHYSSQRVRRDARAARFVAHYRPTGAPSHAAAGSLASFLTDRYCLYALDSRDRVYRCEIDHSKWELQPAELQITANTMTDWLRIELPAVPPLLHFAA